MLLEARDAGSTDSTAFSERLDLLVGQGAEEAQGTEQLGMLLVVGLRLSDGSLSSLGEMEGDAEAEVLAEFGFDSRSSLGLLESANRAFGEQRRAPADEALEAVLHHEVDAAGGGAHDRLPALDGRAERSGDQGELFQFVAAIGNRRRKRVLLPTVRKGFLGQRLHHDVDLLFEDLAVGLLVEHRHSKGLDLSSVIATTHPETDPAPGKDVGLGEVLGQPQRVPGRYDIEAATEAELLCQVGEMHRQHQDVGDALVAFSLEMVLGEPERVVAECVHATGHGLGLGEHAR